MRRKSAAIALLASFLVYLIPLIGPHAAPLLGEMFFGDMYRSRPLWFLTDVVAGLVLQLVAFSVIYLFLQKRSLVRGLALGVAVPAVFVSTQALFMLWIPSIFLIENDTASDAGSWPIECTADDAWIVGVATPHRPLGGAVKEVLIQTSKADYGVLSIPDCMVKPLALPKPTLEPGGHVDFTLGIDYVVPGVAILFYKQETRTGTQAWQIARRGYDDFIPVEAPPGIPKILSSDGKWIGWLDRMQIVIRDVENVKPETRVDLSPFGPASYVLSNIDMRSGEIMLVRNAEFMVLGNDGHVRSKIAMPVDVEVQPSTFRRLGDGWVGWDAYRDEGPYQVSWSLPAGKGNHHVLKGRLINSVAVSPEGDLIAISVGTALSIGNIQDSIYVLRASDGREVFRRFLPRYTRTNLVFPDKDHLLYSADGKTLLLRVSRNQ
jgi:hypothetical protein